MQNAKDTFYEAMRSRLVAVNPERMVVLRGLVRPGLIVEENELVTDTAPLDCFRMRWGATVVHAQAPMPVAAMTCEVLYATAGTGLNSGMDRGRALAAMDGELLQMVCGGPRNAAKLNYAALAQGKSPAAMNTRVWWSDVAFGAEQVKDERVMRTATVTVMSCQEAGEL